MLYAHIYIYYDEFRVCYRRWTRFRDAADEAELGPMVVHTFSEFSGDDMVLAERVAAYLKENNIEITGLPDLSGIDRANSLTLEERMQMLTQSAEGLAGLLEEEREKNGYLERMLGKELLHHEKTKERAAQFAHEVHIHKTLEHIAKDKFGCGHIAAAAVSYEQYKKDHMN